MTQNIPCVGFVVFSTDSTRTILVSTPRGNLSFPKGKRKKGETDLETGLRELEEETGLTENDIIILSSSFVDEKSSKGNTNVRYFVCRIKDDNFQLKIEDEEELQSVEWYDVSKVVDLLKLSDARKTVLTQALNFLS